MRRLVFSRTHTIGTMTTATHPLPDEEMQALTFLPNPPCCHLPQLLKEQPQTPL